MNNSVRLKLFDYILNVFYFIYNLFQDNLKTILNYKG